MDKRQKEDNLFFYYFMKVKNKEEKRFMITIGANGERIAYGIKHYNLDTEQDLKKLPTSREVMGCTCFVIETSKYYMLNSKSEWIEITPFGKAMSSSGSDSDLDEDGIPDSVDPSIDITYEGGII